MDLTIVLKGMICDKVTDNPYPIAVDGSRVKVSTGSTEAPDDEVLGDFGLGKFAKGEVKSLDLGLFSGHINPASPDVVRLDFYEQDLGAFDCKLGRVSVRANGGHIEWAVGEDTLDEGTVLPGDYSFDDFDGARNFLLKGTGGLYHAFITAQLSL